MQVLHVQIDDQNIVKFIQVRSSATKIVVFPMYNLSCFAVSGKSAKSGLGNEGSIRFLNFNQYLILLQVAARGKLPGAEQLYAANFDQVCIIYLREQTDDACSALEKWGYPRCCGNGSQVA